LTYDATKSQEQVVANLVEENQEQAEENQEQADKVETPNHQ